MRTRMFGVGAALSLLLLAATVGIRVYSQWVEFYGWTGAPGPGSAVVVVERGHVQVITCGGWPGGSGWHFASSGISSAGSYTPGIAHDGRGSLSGNWGFDVPGIEVSSQRGWLVLPRVAGTVSTSLPTAPVTLTEVSLIWPAVVFGILPLGWGLVAMRRRTKLKEGRCPSCLYDLTGNTSGVCPECGMAVAGNARPV